MLDLLCCPHCDVSLAKIDFEEEDFILNCKSCGRVYPVVDGIAIVCDDSRKNKVFEVPMLSQFLGVLDHEIDKGLRKEIARIRKLKTDSSWEWDDVEFWGRKYQEKWEKREDCSIEDRFNQWRDRLWQRAPLAKKIKLTKSPNHQNIILDVGSGEGQNAQLFGGRSLYIAVDMSFYALKLAKYFNSRLFCDSLFILCPANRIPIKRNSVDILLCFGILHHCQEKEKTLLPLSRLLKERGHLVLHEPYDRPSITPSFLKLKDEESAHEERIRREDLRQMLNDLECLMMEEGYSILFGFSMRFLRKIVLSKQFIFRTLMRMDKAFLTLFGWMHPALGPGDVRCVYRKKSRGMLAGE